MNSLEELNNYSNNIVTYFDQREPVIFDRPVPENQSLEFDENDIHLLPLGIDILELNDPAKTQLQLRLDLSGIPGTSSIEIDVETVPPSIEITEPTPNIFVISGISTVSQWNFIKDNIIVQVPFGVSGQRFYVAQIRYIDDDFNPITIPWTVSLNIIPQQKLTVPPVFRWYVNTTQTITTAQIIVNTGSFAPIWTMTITPSVPAAVTNMSAAGLTFDPATGVGTVVGTKAEVNAAMAAFNISFANVAENINIEYRLVNDINADISIQNQTARSQDFIALKMFTADLAAEATRFTFAEIEFDVFANIVANVTAIFNFSFDFEVKSNIEPLVGLIKSTGANLSSTFTQEVDGGKVREFSSILSSNFDLSDGSQRIEAAIKLEYVIPTTIPPFQTDTENRTIQIRLGDQNNVYGTNPSGSYVATIYWGDGTTTTTSSARSYFKTYNSPGTYKVTIIGTGDGLPIFGSNVNGFYGSVANLRYARKLTKVISLGTIEGGINLKSLQTAFSASSITEVPNTSFGNLEDLAYCFSDTTNNSPIDNWDTSNVTNMNAMFSGARAFNQPIDNWDTSNVTNMSRMFASATNFNQPLNNWDTSNVIDMSFMFSRLSSDTGGQSGAPGPVKFNQPIDNWDTGNVTNMSFMFYNADAFNQPLNNWDTSNVTNMNAMFSGATAFNQPLNNWDTGNVVNMSRMFGVGGEANDTAAINFNGDISTWNTSKVTNMNRMFADATAFNQPLSNWDTSSVTEITSMFLGASSYNQDLSSWCLSNVDSNTDIGAGPQWVLPKPPFGICLIPFERLITIDTVGLVTRRPDGAASWQEIPDPNSTPSYLLTDLVPTIDLVNNDLTIEGYYDYNQGFGSTSRILQHVLARTWGYDNTTATFESFTFDFMSNGAFNGGGPLIVRFSGNGSFIEAWGDPNKTDFDKIRGTNRHFAFVKQGSFMTVYVDGYCSQIVEFRPEVSQFFFTNRRNKILFGSPSTDIDSFKGAIGKFSISNVARYNVPNATGFITSSITIPTNIIKDNNTIFYLEPDLDGGPNDFKSEV